jgi:hypothetical protein
VYGCLVNRPGPQLRPTAGLLVDDALVARMWPDATGNGGYWSHPGEPLPGWVCAGGERHRRDNLVDGSG